MGEYSYFWDGLVTGDASLAPYASDVMSEIFEKLFIKDRTTMGYIEGVLNEYASASVGSPVVVGSGAALVDGTYHIADAAVNVVVPAPALATRIDRIVLQKDFVNQVVRIALISGIEGGGAPALTQNDGVIWEIPLWQVSITTLGVITLSDERIKCQSAIGAGAQVLEVQVFS